ncbi:hypothetical protein [Chryseobacterium viscerum]|uniref:Uncharacterized protein n=1 Tax=Chryseobacterium viscerum TaxID=1037377 RepID=A0A5N4BSH9_9FLAO|nr:hypothetical protein [Chryseobacterium viscerum]KAB1231347.1 hypothetical protein F8D52_05945 [Chryseobacterium viscerum]
MEENNVTNRDKLKTYFETGKHPTQGQFSDLIDSLKHKEDVLTNKEMVILANRLAIIDNAFAYYRTNNIGNLEFQTVVVSQDEEDQVITVRETNNTMEKQFFLGSAPYTIKLKGISGETLKATEYYLLNCQISQSYTIARLFGNGLDAISDGFEFGVLESKILSLQIFKQDFGQNVKIVNTKIKFVNKTGMLIQYRVDGGLWSDKFKAEDTVTNHYDVQDYLSFFYKADLREINQSIQCDIYDSDNDSLLATSYLYGGQIQDAWYGGQIAGIRNIRIECNYSKNEK